MLHENCSRQPLVTLRKMAGNLVLFTLCKPCKRWSLFCTDGLRLPATVAETTAGGMVGRAGYFTLQDDPLGLGAVWVEI